MNIKFYGIVFITVTLFKDCRCQCMFASNECPNQRIKFWLYKNDTLAEGPLLLDPLNLTIQNFEPIQPLKILIHGYTGHRDQPPNAEVRPALLQAEPVHVLSVDYGTLAKHPCYYPWAVVNARNVAKCLAQLLDNLIEAGIYRRDDIHLIGFSLGAQIAGLTANYVQHKLRRITGLDPAGPGFSISTSLDNILDVSDADFVDVIHTDPFLFAVQLPNGHADFYPNLEYFSQPGCTFFQHRGVQTRTCSHYRAPIYYAESITTKNGFWSYSCGNWWDFFARNCQKYANREHVLMGYFVSENATGSYFLTTNSEAPFAKGFVFNGDIELEVIEKNHTGSTAVPDEDET